MYTFDSRIRYSETDSEGRLTLEALLDYFQDCSTFHSEDLGVGLQYLKERKMVWVLSSWQIVVDRFPNMCERVTVGTFPYDFKGCFGYRNFYMQDASGAYIAKANTLWTLLDTEKFRPAHPTEEMLQKYVLEERLPMTYAGRKIEVPEDGGYQEEIIVRPHHLDTNHHVNNGQYVRMAMECLPEHFAVSQMRAEYKKQALLHDVLYPYTVCRQGEDGKEIRVVSLQDKAGGIYVNIEFTGKEKV